MSLHNRQRFEPHPFGTVIFADLHEASAAFAPFCKLTSIYPAVFLHPSSRVLIRRVDMPMCVDIGSAVPAAFNYLPMSDALDLAS
jgi:hypothetical protein